MNSSRYRDSQLKYFCSLIGSHPTELTEIMDNIDDHFKEWFEVKTKSDGQPKTYKNGRVKTRVIRPPKERLKEIQSRIKDELLAPIPLPDNIHGGVKRKSNITNAVPHKGHKYQFVTDARDFYPSVNHNQVYSMLLRQGMTSFFASWITKLCTWKGQLPQGAPTSTHLANLVFLETDIKLIELCDANGITYTRYVDDLTFSSQQDFKHLLNELLKLIVQGGFKVNYRKTTYGGKQLVTGIEVTNNALVAPKEIQEKARLEVATNSPNKPYANYQKSIEQANSKRK